MRNRIRVHKQRDERWVLICPCCRKQWHAPTWAFIMRMAHAHITLSHTSRA